MVHLWWINREHYNLRSGNNMTAFIIDRKNNPPAGVGGPCVLCVQFIEILQYLFLNQAKFSSIAAVRMFFCVKPTHFLTIWPSLNRMMVGIELMEN